MIWTLVLGSTELPAASRLRSMVNGTWEAMSTPSSVMFAWVPASIHTVASTVAPPVERVRGVEEQITSFLRVLVTGLPGFRVQVSEAK